MKQLILFLLLISCQSKDNGKVAVTDIVLDRDVVTIVKGSDMKIIAKLFPYNTTEKVEWTSSDTKIATVNDGIVKGIASGNAVITAKAGNKSATCPVRVKKALIGLYYFDGWAGINRNADNPSEPWAVNAPTHLTRRFVEQFPGREPIWGWRDDTQAIVEQQIDLAADNGVDFFLYCWYWHNNQSAINVAAINSDSKHTGMNLHLTAKNKSKLRIALLIANHSGAEIIGNDNWTAAVEHWATLMRDPQYMTVDGKPLIVIFSSADAAITSENIDKMQQKAISLGFKDGLAIAGCGANARNKDGFTHTTHYNIVPGYSAGSAEHDFKELVTATQAQWTGSEKQPYIPQLTSGWDKRPWEGPTGSNQVEGWYYTGDTPDVFKAFLNDAITWMDNNPTKTTKERIALIYAWNEFGEGGYLAPTKDDPTAAKLRKIKELLNE